MASQKNGEDYTVKLTARVASPRVEERSTAAAKAATAVERV